MHLCDPKMKPLKVACKIDSNNIAVFLVLSQSFPILFHKAQDDSLTVMIRCAE